MRARTRTYKLLLATLLCCILQVAEIDVYAQEPTATQDSVPARREAPKSRARRQRQPVATPVPVQQNTAPTPITDTLSAATNLVADSLAAANAQAMEQLERPIAPAAADSLPLPESAPKKLFIPNSTRATWLAAVIPGGGQIYNRKYWKLPIIYGGFAGCAYALSWNSKMYKDYSQAYLDIMDSNPETKSYEQLLPPNASYNEEQLKSTLKRRKDTFRRYRDLSIFAFIGVYLISIIDAYVDAELSDFDISPDLSMRIEPAVLDNYGTRARTGSLKEKSMGVQCVLRF